MFSTTGSEWTTEAGMAVNGGTRKALIAGGGIAGLATAIALVRAGWRVDVFERAPELREVGAGLQISPNGAMALRALGVPDDWMAQAFEPHSIEFRFARSGRRYAEIPMGLKARQRWGAPYLQIHRSDVLTALSSKLQSLQPDAVQTGRTVTDVSISETTAALVFADGSTEEGALVVGADGVRSTVRTSLFGSEALRFTGQVAWRCTVPAAALGEDAPPATGCIWTAPGRHVVTTRIRAGNIVNFVGMVEESDWTEEGWSVTGTQADAKFDFKNWARPIEAVLDNAETLNRWALYDRAPLPSWSKGPAVLLGDAAHPMLPSLAQGAVQSLEDAVVLAKCVSQNHDLTEACRSFFNERINRATRVQRVSRANARTFHYRNPLFRIGVPSVLYGMSQLAPSLHLKRLDWLYGFDPALPLEGAKRQSG